MLSQHLTLQDVYCTVELNGQHTRGQMVIDWQDQMKQKANVRLISSVDMEKVLRMLKDSVRESS